MPKAKHLGKTKAAGSAPSPEQQEMEDTARLEDVVGGQEGGGVPKGDGDGAQGDSLEQAGGSKTEAVANQMRQPAKKRARGQAPPPHTP